VGSTQKKVGAESETMWGGPLFHIKTLMVVSSNSGREMCTIFLGVPFYDLPLTTCHHPLVTGGGKSNIFFILCSLSGVLETGASSLKYSLLFNIVSL
jgi:hypothetical protein